MTETNEITPREIRARHLQMALILVEFYSREPGDYSADLPDRIREAMKDDDFRDDFEREQQDHWKMKVWEKVRGEIWPNPNQDSDLSKTPPPEVEGADEVIPGGDYRGIFGGMVSDFLVDLPEFSMKLGYDHKELEDQYQRELGPMFAEELRENIERRAKQEQEAEAKRKLRAEARRKRKATPTTATN